MWLIPQTRITNGAAVGHTAWAKRTRTHPRVLAALPAGELAARFAEMYEGARSDLPDEDPDRDFEDRGLKLAVTFGGAGVLHGDLTPECANWSGGCWTRWAPRPGKRMTGPGTSGTTMPPRKLCANSEIAS